MATMKKKTAGLMTSVAMVLPMHFEVNGALAVAVGDTDYICPQFVKVPLNQKVHLIYARHRINGGTSANVKLIRNDDDLTGYTSITVDTDPADTESAVELFNNDMLALVINSITGAPYNMSFDLFLEYLTILGAVLNGSFNDFTMEDDANVLGHWVFDSVYRTAEDSGNAITADLSGNSNDLTANNFSTDFADELTGSNPAYSGGNALAFDGTSQYLSISAANATDFNPGTGDFTIEIRFKTDTDISTFQPLIIKGNNNANNDTYMVFISSGNLRARVYDSSGNAYIAKNTAISASTEYCLAISVDRDGDQFAYLNGTQIWTQSVSNSVDISNSENLYVGIENTLAAYYGAEISEIRFSNVARTAKEIKESYGLAKHWTWDGIGAVSNDNFGQKIESGGKVTQMVRNLDGNKPSTETIDGTETEFTASYREVTLNSNKTFQSVKVEQ